MADLSLGFFRFTLVIMPSHLGDSFITSKCLNSNKLSAFLSHSITVQSLVFFPGVQTVRFTGTERKSVARLTGDGFDTDCTASLSGHCTHCSTGDSRSDPTILSNKLKLNLRITSMMLCWPSHCTPPTSLLTCCTTCARPGSRSTTAAAAARGGRRGVGARHQGQLRARRM